MKIIKKEANPSGGYPGIQEGNWNSVPEGMAVWPETLETATFYDYNGFVKLDIQPVEGVDTVNGYVPDTGAWEAWKASLPEPGQEPAPEPTDGEILDVLLGVTAYE